jgi:hypothetical protein
LTSIDAKNFALSHRPPSPNFTIEEHPQIVDWFSLTSPQYQLFANSGNAGR